MWLYQETLWTVNGRFGMSDMVVNIVVSLSTVNQSSSYQDTNNSRIGGYTYQ